MDSIKLKSLFIDNSQNSLLGILNASLEFETYDFFDDKRGASQIHFRLDNLLRDNDIKLNDIKSLYIISGPGSYTGIRVVEGIAQIMKWQGKEVFSLYQFEIPQMVGVEKGSWISQAYKNEFFIYSWQGKEYDIQLISHDEYQMTREEFDLSSTRKLLLKHSRQIFSMVKGRGGHFPPYYYREAEQEFKTVK